MREDPALARAIKIGDSEIKAKLKLIEADKESVHDVLRNA